MKRSFHGGMKRKVLVGISAALVGLTPVIAQAANKLIVKDSTGTTDKMVVTDTGRIGINSSSPNTAISINGVTAADSLLQIQYTGAGGTTTEKQTSGGFIALRNELNGGLPTASDRLGVMFFGSMLGATPRYSAGFAAYAESAWSNTSTPTFFTIETIGPNSAARYERVRVSGAGNVGIDTKNPTQKLEVNGGIRLNPGTSISGVAVTRPACASWSEGTLWLTKGSAGVSDMLIMCIKDDTDAYVWKQIPFGATIP